MAHETVPADIAAAINLVISSAVLGGALKTGTDQWSVNMAAHASNREILDAAILHHLRHYQRSINELTAALERIEQGA